MTLAVFDIDGTLLTGRSTEKRFYAYLYRQGLIGARQHFAYVSRLLLEFPEHRTNVLKKCKAYLKDLPAESVRDAAQDWVHTVSDADWSEVVVSRLRRHIDSGDDVMLMSGTLQCVAEAIGHQLGVNTCIGSIVPECAGKFTAGRITRHPFGKQKRTLVEEFATDRGISLSDVVAYADSVHDIDLLTHVGSPVAVLPDAGLAATASAHQWEILGA